MAFQALPLPPPPLPQGHVNAGGSWGAWVAQWVKHLTLTQVMISWFVSLSPTSGPLLSPKTLLQIPCPPLSAPFLLALLTDDAPSRFLWNLLLPLESVSMSYARLSPPLGALQPSTVVGQNQAVEPNSRGHRERMVCPRWHFFSPRPSGLQTTAYQFLWGNVTGKSPTSVGIQPTYYMASTA